MTGTVEKPTYYVSPFFFFKIVSCSLSIGCGAETELHANGVQGPGGAQTFGSETG